MSVAETFKLHPFQAHARKNMFLPKGMAKDQRRGKTYMQVFSLKPSLSHWGMLLEDVFQQILMYKQRALKSIHEAYCTP